MRPSGAECQFVCGQRHLFENRLQYSTDDVIYQWFGISRMPAKLHSNAVVNYASYKWK